MANVVTFRTMEGKNTTEEKMKLIQVASKLKTSKPLKHPMKSTQLVMT